MTYTVIYHRKGEQPHEPQSHKQIAASSLEAAIERLFAGDAPADQDPDEPELKIGEPGGRVLAWVDVWAETWIYAATPRQIWVRGAR